MGSHHEGGKSTCYPCCHLVSFTFLDFWVNARALISPPPRGALCGLITVSTEFHFSQGILAILMSSALCSSVLIIDYFPYDSHFIFPEKAISRILLDLFLARLLDSFQTGWPCIRWPSLATCDLKIYLNGTSSTPILNLLYSWFLTQESSGEIPIE